MKLRTVGLRVALFGILALVVGGTMAMTGSAGGFAPSEAVAAEKVGVPVVSKAIVPPAARVSPFFATPTLNGMLLEARTRSPGSRLLLAHPYPDWDCGVPDASHYGGNAWYIDMDGVMSCVDDTRDWIEGHYVQFQLSWAVFDDEQSVQLTCWGWNDTCRYSDYHYTSNYDCVGNESIMIGIDLWHWYYFPYGWFWYWDVDAAPSGGCN